MGNISSVDLNLLGVAAALFRTRNVSKAARELGVTQSAVSHSLSRLRDEFKDPMFVRTSRGVAPTEFALSIESDVMDLVHRAELLVARKSRFEPSEARGRITIASTDMIEAVLLSRLVSKLQKEAPSIQLSLRPTAGDLPRSELESGSVDLAIAGFYSRMPEGFFQSKLGSDSFACAVRKGHPVFGHLSGKQSSKQSREAYFAAHHALVTLQGDFDDDVSDEDQPDARTRKNRKISYGSYSFTGGAWVLQSTDLVLTAPRSLLEEYRRFFPITVFACPVELGALELRMVWHARTQQDPLRKWFRELLRKVASEVFSR